MATFIRKNAKKQTTRFAGCLEIGSKMKIPIKIYTKVIRIVVVRDLHLWEGVREEQIISAISQFN